MALNCNNQCQSHNHHGLSLLKPTDKSKTIAMLKSHLGTFCYYLIIKGTLDKRNNIAAD